MLLIIRYGLMQERRKLRRDKLEKKIEEDDMKWMEQERIKKEELDRYETWEFQY
jgi:hypothetical protein